MTADRRLAEVWIPVGSPGFSGDAKSHRQAALDARFGPDGWRWAWYVRGALVDFGAAIAEYEESYRVHLGRNPAIVEWLVDTCGNVYDHHVDNVFDDDYEQPSPAANHYQDVAVRRVIAELTGATGEGATPPVEPVELVDLGTGRTHLVPRAPGFRGRHLAQIRDARSAGYFLSPALVPVHDPALITTIPARHEWYHREGCGHLSVEAFWQMSKVVEVRFDRFTELGDGRDDPLAGI